VEEFGEPGGLLEFLGIEGLECVGQEFDSAAAAFLEELGAFGSGFEAEAAFVGRGGATHQAGTYQAGDDAAHGGGADLFGFGQLAEGTRPSKDQDRESGKLGRADAGGGGIAGTDAAEQVDGGGMDFVADLDGIRGREYLVLAFGHRI
jgi:hypothetical protein